MKKIKKLLLSLTTATMFFSMMGTTAFAQGDPPTTEEENGVVLPENPVDEVAEDDHTPISFDGTGTVIDNIENGSKHFYTISTDAGNVFYLIVDLDKDYNNVYFLDTTKERDLIALAEKAEEQEGTEVIDEQPVPQVVEPETPQEPEVKEPPVQKSNNSAIYIILGILLIAGIGVVFYYWVYKPKKDIEQAEEFDENFDFKNEDKSFDDALQELNSYED